MANALAAAAVGEGLGLRLEQIAAGLAALAAVPGRLERIEHGQPFLVVVDYAHTPDSLAKVLRPAPADARPAHRRLRQRRRATIAKRAIQGRVSQELADITIDERGPRFEDAAAIVDEIAAGAVAAGGRTAATSSGRRIAWRPSIWPSGWPGRATPSLAGKGHEQSIIVGAEKQPWDDREAARAALRALGWTGEA